MDHKMFRFVLLLFCAVGISCQDPEVEIPQGRLSGGTRTNRDGGTYYSFQNVPFGKPPVGDLRFKAPEPADAWEGTRDATEDLPMCISAGDSSSTRGQEDCLYLNVYTPALPSGDFTQKPVMVYIFGGGFNGGTAAETDLGAEFLLTKDVVLVIPNYRVGAFGYLSIDDPDLGVTGNVGMKDHVLALQWVRDNIEYFGGDPNNVLLFGESSGSMSVHLHMLSPMSAGLFHKAISESGCALTEIAKPVERNNGLAIAEELGIQTENLEDMLASLRNVSAESLAIASLVARDSLKPIVEIPSNEPSFLSRNPLDIIRSGVYSHIPYIIGFNDAEGISKEASALESTGQSILITDFSAYIPSDLQLEAGSEEEQILSQRIKQFYYGDTEPSRDDISGAVYLYTDYAFGFPAYRSTLEHIKSALSPIYFFIFSGDTELNYSKQGNNITFPGASHTDELAYLFYSTRTPETIEDGSVEDLGIRRMVNMWTNFATYSNPTPEGSDYIWEPVQEDQFNYIQIDTEEPLLGVNPKSENFKFWLEVYEDYFPDVLTTE